LVPPYEVVIASEAWQSPAFTMRLLRHCRASQRQGGSRWDCFGTIVPRNDKGGCHCERSVAIPCFGHL